MPTAEQLQQRSELIQNWIKRFNETPDEEIPQTIKDTPTNIRDSVLAGAYENDRVLPKMMTPKQALRVAERFLKECGDRHRDSAANRGSEVHALAEAISNGESVDIPEELQGHLTSWKNFVDAYQLQFLRTEFTVYSVTDDYAGTGDALCYSANHPEFGLIALDYKTSESGIFSEIALQLSALRFADYIWAYNPDTQTWHEDTETLRQIKTFWGVQITGKGYKVVPVTANAAIFNVFRAAAITARYRREFMNQVLGEAEFVPNEGENNDSQAE